MGNLELMCNLMLKFRSEILRVSFIDFVLNLEIAVYCTNRLHTLYLMTSCSRWYFKLLLSVPVIILDLVIEILLEFAPLRLVNINQSIE
jgi:hypothetical protein